MWKPIKALEQSFIRTKQKDFIGFDSMMNIRTNSSNNTVYADSDGNIAYYHGNFISKRNEKYDYNKPVDGHLVETDWNGIHTLKENIFVFNPPTNWLQNCNSTPFSTYGIGSVDKSKYPRYMSNFPENYRSLHAIDLLKDVEKINLEGLKELAYDDFIPGGKILCEKIIIVYASTEFLNENEKIILDYLKDWDFRVDVNSVQMTFLDYFMHVYFEHNFNNNSRYFIQQMNHVVNNLSDEQIKLIVNKAANLLYDEHQTIVKPWGEYCRFQRLSGHIDPIFNDELESMPIGLTSGRWGALASFGTIKYQTNKIYGVSGNSFVAVVEFGKRIKAKSLLAGGQSSHVDSPHFDDQIHLYAEGRFKDVQFYKEDIIENMSSIYRP